MTQTQPIYPTKQKIEVGEQIIVDENCYHNNKQCNEYKILKKANCYALGAPSDKNLCEECERLNKLQL